MSSWKKIAKQQTSGFPREIKRQVFGKARRSHGPRGVADHVADMLFGSWGSRWF